MDDDAATERQLQDLVAAIGREDAARDRRAARWRDQLAVGERTVMGELSAALRSGAPVVLAVLGAGSVRATRVLATSGGWAAIDGPGGEVSLVALDAVDAAVADAPARERAIDRDRPERPPAVAPELGSTLGDVLEALAPAPVEVMARSGWSVRGVLVGAGAAAVVEEASGRTQVVALDAIGLVRLGPPGLRPQSSSPPLSPLPTTSG